MRLLPPLPGAMATPSLLSMAVDGSTLALYFSEPIKSV
jgi:hypothetical protein